MSFIKKTLARIGIGAAEVDAVLDTDRACPGEHINGTIHIYGGETAQVIDKIDMALMTQYRQKTDEGYSHVICPLSKAKVGEGFEVKPGEQSNLPFTLQVPWETPLTLGSTQVWVQTQLAVDMALDPADRDQLHIEPTPGMATVFQAVEQLGFTLRKADCELNRRTGRPVPFVQEFEYRPGGAYANRLSELEMIMMADANGVQIWLESDVRTGGLAGMLLSELDLDERFTQVNFDHSLLNKGVAAVTRELQQAIDSRLSH